MEPITMLILAGMGIASEIRKREREKEERRTNEENLLSDSHSLLQSAKPSASAAQPEIKKEQDTRMCQPNIKPSDNNKFKAK